MFFEEISEHKISIFDSSPIGSNSSQFRMKFVLRLDKNEKIIRGRMKF